MKRIFVPTRSGSDWQRLLSKPDLHWKVGKSAMSLAACWEDSYPNLPPEVASACSGAGVRNNYLAAFPEWEVELPGGSTSSHTDLLVLAKSTGGLTVIAVEGKVDETFGPTLGEKRNEASPGQLERLSFLHESLGLTEPAPDRLRYQLVHRTVSALPVARDFGASQAIMLVHSFSGENRWFDDYAAFAEHLGVTASKGVVQRVPTMGDLSLLIGWVSGDTQYLTSQLPAAT